MSYQEPHLRCPSQSEPATGVQMPQGSPCNQVSTDGGHHPTPAQASSLSLDKGLQGMKPRPQLLLGLQVVMICSLPEQQLDLPNYSWGGGQVADPRKGAREDPPQEGLGFPHPSVPAVRPQLLTSFFFWKLIVSPWKAAAKFHQKQSPWPVTTRHPHGFSCCATARAHQGAATCRDGARPGARLWAPENRDKGAGSRTSSPTLSDDRRRD